MGLHPRECLTYYHLIGFAGLVVVSIILIIIGGSLSAWCVIYGNSFECYSLLLSERAYSCLFKLIPTGAILSLIVSLFMFIILIIGQVITEYTGIAKKEYQLVARLINVFALSVAIILIMIVLLQWYHPPTDASKNLTIVIIPVQDEGNSTSKSKLDRAKSEIIPPGHPLYSRIANVQRRPIADYHESLNHGPNLFFAAFIILFITLITFILGHRL